MYVGTAYHGWQVQKTIATVAETLEKALSTVVCHPVKCTGAGRTDAGVHAEAYIANFYTDSAIPADRIPLAVNTRLPDDIVVISGWDVPQDFNAIGSCIKRSIRTGSITPASATPFLSTGPGSTPSPWTRRS